MHTNNTTIRYHLVEVQYNAELNRLEIVRYLYDFDDKNQMLLFFASYIADDSYNKYWSDMNITGKDVTVYTQQVPVRNSDGILKLDSYGEVLYDLKIVKSYKRYLLYDDNWAYIDVRNYMQEILRLSVAIKRKLINNYFTLYPEYAFYIIKHRRHRGKHPKTHTYCGYRHIRKYNKIKNEYDFVYEDADIYYKYVADPESKSLRCHWCDDSWGRKSTGWKDHKCKHQWEHKVLYSFKRMQKKQKMALKEYY